MGSVARQDDSAQRPLVATSRHEGERTRSQSLDAVFRKPDRVVQSIPAARMGNVGVDDLACLFGTGHLLTIFALQNDKLEPP